MVLDCGQALEDTAVTSNQVELLIEALRHADNKVKGPVIEVGSYRGTTTTRLATSTSKTVYAVDPYVGYGGSEMDYTKFTPRPSRSRAELSGLARRQRSPFPECRRVRMAPVQISGTTSLPRFSGHPC